MTGRYLLDTNIVIAALSSDPDVIRHIDDADEYFSSTTVVGEMVYGAMNSTHVAKNLARIESFIAGSGVLTCDLGTARVYGEIKTALRKKGKPIPENDIWIAASAIQHSLTLVSRDAHFVEVDGLALARW